MYLSTSTLVQLQGPAVRLHYSCTYSLRCICTIFDRQLKYYMYTDSKVGSSIYQILDLLYALHILLHVSSLSNFIKSYQSLIYFYIL